MNAHYRYLFGPVPSRRFGLSLGLDLVPFKTCTFDCVFCQLGRTTVKTLARADYVPAEAVVEEVARWLGSGGRADYLTLAGSGEPTLHERCGEVIRRIRSMTDIPVALLTNGSLLWDPRVRDAAAEANVVKLSLSAWDDASCRLVNRPHPDLSWERMWEGHRRLRDDVRGALWVEVFLVRGVNSADVDVGKIAGLAALLKPDRIHLNTAVRPSAEDFVRPVPHDQMVELASLFTPPAEVIGDFRTATSPATGAREETILAMLARRPCTADQIASVFGMHRNEVAKYVGELLREGRISAERVSEEVFYRASGGKPVALP